MPASRKKKMITAALLMAVGYAHAAGPSGESAKPSVIYKYVDPSGHVTYANSPIKGGVILNPEPLTVIPSPKPPAIATVKTAQNTVIIPPAPATNSTTAQQRTAIETNLKLVQQALKDAQERLNEERANSETIRALRATYASDGATAASSNKPLMPKEVRQLIERHFEQIRNLQDRVIDQENKLAALKDQLGALATTLSTTP
ncbi:MAG: hypothetical protein JNM52_04805 [Betaproteobacteria bacterium]|nr:hypothetical protein [Betaproteobacteria bacterium]